MQRTVTLDKFKVKAIQQVAKQASYLLTNISNKNLRRLMFAAGMHFQDRYNYNIDRVKRCVIHYAAPNGLIYPFCAYNSGPVFRKIIEKKYSVSVEDWVKRNGGEYITEGFYRG